MSKITQFDKVSLDLIEKRVEAALRPLAEELGLHIHRNGGRYSDSNFDMKVRISLTDPSGKAIPKHTDTFKLHADILGMKVSDLGRTVRCAGREFELTGYNPRCHKFPFVGKDPITGKEFKLPLKAVKTSLGYKVEAWEE